MNAKAKRELLEALEFERGLTRTKYKVMLEPVEFDYLIGLVNRDVFGENPK